MKYHSSLPASVEKCAKAFETYAVNNLPSKFEQISESVVPTYCKTMTYEAGHTNISRSTWQCPNGYVLQPQMNLCER